MAVFDLDIRTSAHDLAKQYGESALLKARERVDEMRRNGDHEGAATWLRVMVILFELRAERSDMPQ
jgi:hypothetical protein